MSAKDTAGNFIPFNFTRVRCNLADETGGTRETITGAVLAGAPFGKKDPERDPNHWMNATRNIYIPGKSRPVTIQLLLLLTFNDERVYL